MIPPDTKDENIWTESFDVRTFETDVTGRLGMLHLFNYFQEVAGNHARELGVSIEKLQAKQLTWMLSRFHIQVDHYPARGDTLVIKTWPSSNSGLHALREFILYTREGEQIGTGTSGWLIIDLKRFRPIRMPDFITVIEMPDLPRPLPDPFNKLPSPEKGDVGEAFTVGYHDLDINQHANSVHFIRWALESIPDEVRASHQLHGLEVQFRAEAKYGDLIVSRMIQGKDELTFLHGLYEESSDKELAVIRSSWR